ncbi:18067_t:CDS:2, partial [Gigaspora margarita]
EKQSLLSDNNFEGTNNRTESQLEKNIEEITFNNIIEYISNKISDLEEDSVDEIEEGDRYKWTWYCELERDYKESNCKRIDCFDYHGKLIIDVDIAAKEAKIKLNVTTPKEIKCEIIQNLYMDSVQLRTHIHQIFDDTLQVNIQKSIISIAFYESDNNLIKIDKEDEVLGSGSENTLAEIDEND